MKVLIFLLLLLLLSSNFPAVAGGSLKQLQAALDRRKFCLTRDPTTDVSLLQKALLLGHTDVSR